jgi:hypothetical protein
VSTFVPSTYVPSTGAYDPGVYDPEEVPDPNRELAEADTGYVGPDIETDQTVIAQLVFDRLATRVPGWAAHDGNPDVWLIEAFSAVAAELRAQAADVPGAVIATFGTEVLGMPIRQPAPAVGVTRWVARDIKGYTIQPGTTIVVPRTGDELVGFAVVDGAVIPPDETEVAGVVVRAVVDGAEGNGLVGPAEMSDPYYDWCQLVEVTQPTVQGDDGQTMSGYLDNLSNLLRMMAFRPILPYDFALLAMQIPGVGRAVAMDGYEPTDQTWYHQREIALVVTDAAGEPLPDATKNQIRAFLENAREVNFLIPVIDAAYADTDVQFEVTAYAEQDVDLVNAICVDAITQLLSPRYYRLGTTSPGISAGEVIPPPATGAQPGRMTIRLNEIVGILDRCRGVDWVGPVTIDGVAADKILVGPTTLPRAGVVAGVVNPG